MEIKQAQDLYLSQLKDKNYSLQTIDNYHYAIQTFFKYLKVGGSDFKTETLSKDEISQYIDYVTNLKNKQTGKVLSPRTHTLLIEVAQRFLIFLEKNEYVFWDLHQHLNRKKKGDYIYKNVLSESEIEKILSLPNILTYLGFRDKVIFELFYHTGLRKSELVNLEIYDLDFDEKTLFVRNGKGKKDRIVPIGLYLEKLLLEYFKNVRPWLIADSIDENKVFVSSKGTGLTDDGLSSRIMHYKRRTDIHFSAHSFRHAFATHLLKHGASIVYIQKLLGHQEISSTNIYTKVYPVELKRIILENHPRNMMKTINDFDLKF